MPDPTATSCVAACPEHAHGSPCACDAGYVFDAARTSCLEQYTLALTPGGGTIEPGKTLAFTATVADRYGNPPKTPVGVKVALWVEARSGGHDHGDATRPRGSLDGAECLSDATCIAPQMSGGAPAASFEFKAPEASGKHTIAATCDLCANRTVTATVEVKVPGLLPIPASELYALNESDGSVIGARTGWHTQNHNMTPAAATALWQLAARYRFESRFQPTQQQRAAGEQPRKLHLNDASLPWGGVYDICARPGACPTQGLRPWKTPHREHRRGTEVDVRANGTEGTIPAGSVKTLFGSSDFCMG